ncbi:MAG: hypothetical protein AAF234_16085 [Pseudomonadota bacterium]
MASVYIKLDYASLEKPFCLAVRDHDLGGVDWGWICRLDFENARLLASETNIPWWMDEPDWDAYFKRIARMEAERDIREAQKRLSALDDAP